MSAPRDAGFIDYTCPPRTEDKYGLDRHDHDWLNRFLMQHAAASGLLKTAFYSMLKAKSKREANATVMHFHDRAVRKDLWLSMDDARLRDWCEAKARHCWLTTTKPGRDPLVAQKRVCQMLNSYGIEFPLKAQNELLAGFCPFESAYLKLGDWQWWRREIRTLQKRELEEFARASGIVHTRKQIYCSDHNVAARVAQKKRNRALLSELEATNELGDTYTLEELAGLSVSNPAIRRSELMVRIAGFEEYAERLGYVGEFYTVTCPSRFHRKTTVRDKWGHLRGVIDNEKYNGSSVRDAHDYLVNVGCLIRSALHRRDLPLFGFRVAEPHHDGCPHWHYLVFVPADRQRECRRVFRHYAMVDSPTEKGARRNRFKAVGIDKARGSAAGYIAKYIAKNIDGAGLEADLYGHDAHESASRIDAWASCHGVRQFQQIGGPSVTVWRELRRLDEQDPGTLETARIAADSANWADFCELMGSGRSQPIKPAYWQEIDTATGEVSPVVNKYGEPVAGRLFGLLCGELRSVCTRFYSWTVSRVQTAFKPWQAGVREGVALFCGVPLPSGANAPPWSSVNNCTALPGAG